MEREYLDLVIKGITGSLDTSLPASWKFNIQAPQEFKKVITNGSIRTLIGAKRLENIHYCIERVVAENIPGDFIEAGCWRGGAIIFMKACLQVYEKPKPQIEERQIWCADLFPESNEFVTSYWKVLLLKLFINYHHLFSKKVKNWVINNFMEAFPREEYSDSTIQKLFALAKMMPWVKKTNLIDTSVEDFKESLRRYNLLDDRIKFLPGWFKDTLPTAEKQIKQLAILRADADFYQSTREILESLYHKLSIGGFCIIDDYGAFDECKCAVDEFREQNNILDEMISIDGIAYYWKRS